MKILFNRRTKTTNTQKQSVIKLIKKDREKRLSETGVVSLY